MATKRSADSGVGNAGGQGRKVLGHPGGLPRPLAGLVGRETERRDLVELIAQRRLVTLSGPAGVGKTRLAVEVAWEVADWMSDGGSFIELAGVADPVVVPAVVATGLGVPETAADGPLEALASVLAHRELLIVLDNCEHVVDAAAAVVTDLLARTSAIRVLATSREPLRIAGEAVFRLDPLPIPDAGIVGDGDAVDLFVTRAREANHRFALRDEDGHAAVELASRLDGLPLAIELVAAHAAAFSTAELLERLERQPELFVDPRRGVTDRHRSLNAAIQWSDALLTRSERSVLYRLSVFAGGCTIDAAQRVCTRPGDLSGSDVAGAVAALVVKSLVVARPAPGSTRYLLLDTVGRYASYMLEAADESRQLHAAHLAWLVDMATSAAASLGGPDRADGKERLEREIDNLSAGLSWAVEHDPAGALELATTLGQWWRTVGRLREGRRWLEKAVDANPDGPPVNSAAALVELGLILQDQLDVVGSFSVHRQALAKAELSGDGALRTRATIGMAQALRDSGDYDTAARVAEEALSLARDRSDGHGQIRALATLAFVNAYRGEFNQAQAVGNQAVRFLVDGQNDEEAWEACAAAAIANLLAGVLDVAEDRAKQALTIAEQLGSPFQVAWTLSTVGGIAGIRRNAPEEIDYGRRCLDLSVQTGSKRSLSNALMCLAHGSGLAEDYQLGATLAGATCAIARREGFALPPGFDRYVKLDSYAQGFGVDPDDLQVPYQRGLGMATIDVIELARTVTPTSREDRPNMARTVERLSPRERQLIDLVAAGLTDAQIGERLFISIRTVHSHLDRIREKTGARRRAELTRLAATFGSPEIPAHHTVRH